MAFPIIIYGAAIATNVVFTNCVSDFCGQITRAELPVQCPFADHALARFSYDTNLNELTLKLKTGWELELTCGCLTWFEAPDHLAGRGTAQSSRKDQIPLKEALIRARAFVDKFGIRSNETWVHLEPRIQKPERFTPYYEFDWYEPHTDDTATVSLAVHSQNGTVIYANLSALRRRLISVNYSKLVKANQGPEPANTAPASELTHRLFVRMISDLRDWSVQLGIPQEIQMDSTLKKHIVTWRCVRGERATQLWTTAVHYGGWRIGFRDGKLCSWRSPDAFFDFDQPLAGF